MLAIPSPRRNQTDQTDQSDLDQDGFWNEGRFAKYSAIRAWHQLKHPTFVPGTN